MNDYRYLNKSHSLHRNTVLGVPFSLMKIKIYNGDGKSEMREKFFDISKIDRSVIEDFEKILEIVETINSNPKMKEEIESFISKK